MVKTKEAICLETGNDFQTNIILEELLPRADCSELGLKSTHFDVYWQTEIEAKSLSHRQH